jgi:hypothetical protein
MSLTNNSLVYVAGGQRALFNYARRLASWVPDWFLGQ